MKTPSLQPTEMVLELKVDAEETKLIYSSLKLNHTLNLKISFKFGSFHHSNIKGVINPLRGIDSPEHLSLVASMMVEEN